MGVTRAAWMVVLTVAGAAMAEAQSPPAKPPSGWQSAKPAGNHETRTLVAGGTRLTFYELSTEEPLAMTAKGPATLMIQSVQEFPAGTATEQEYTFLVEADKKPGKQTAKSGPDKVVKFLTAPDKSSPGERKLLKLEIPAGDHSYVFKKDPACTKTVLLKMYVRPKFPDASRSTLIESKGKKYRYYALTANEPVRINATGPMELRLSSKLEFPKDAKATDSYGIFFALDGGRAQRDSFNATRSKSGKFVKPPQEGALPGGLRSKVYDVPAGKHTFVFTLEKGSKQTVWVRLSLRKK